MVYQVVLVQSATQKETPLLVFPLILEEEASDAYILLESSVVAEDDILQSVVVIFSAKSQVGRHEEQFVERVNILCSCHVSEIMCSAIRLLSLNLVFFRTLSDAAVITLAGCGLE